MNSAKFAVIFKKIERFLGIQIYIQKYNISFLKIEKSRPYPHILIHNFLPNQPNVTKFCNIKAKTLPYIMI